MGACIPLEAYALKEGRAYILLRSTYVCERGRTHSGMDILKPVPTIKSTLHFYSSDEPNPKTFSACSVQWRAIIVFLTWQATAMGGHTESQGNII